MNSNLFKKAINTLQLLVFLIIPAVMYAPPIPPGPGSTTPSPIDGGLIFLLVLGASYGIKRLVDVRREVA